MKTFQEWHDELISDTRWYEQVSMKYKGTFKKACEKLFDLSVSDPDLFNRPIQAQRSHLVNMVWKMPIEKVNFVQTHQVEEKPKENWVPLTGEARQNWLKKFMDAVSAAPIIKPQRKLTSQQLEEEGQVRPKAVRFQRSEVETRLAAIQVVLDAKEARRKTFREVFPDATAIEVEAYVMKFSHIDNPDNL